MSTATGVRHPKGPTAPPTGISAGAFFSTLVDSSVGAKVLVALTGLGLVGFVIVHMVGNWKLLFGGPESREAINAYAYFLKHDLGAWLWLFRGGLLAIFVLHIAL